MQKTLIILSGLLLMSCASSGPSKADARRAILLEDVRVGEQVEEICFSRQIDRFRENGRDSVVLTRGASDEFLLMIRGCPLLSRAQSIRTGNRGCLRDMGNIFVSDTVSAPLSGVPQRIDTCPVHAIYRWNEDAEDQPPVTEK